MVEPTDHCPYLGLKQNRAIRFSSPTPEHRCYVSGEPIDIPVDQASYCLSQGHVHCPLYMGLSVPTTSATALPPEGTTVVVPAAGLRGWLATLPPRDRVIYAIMIGMLALIVAIYLFAGLQALSKRTDGAAVAGEPTAAPATAQPGLVPPPALTTAIPPTPTDIPTSTPSPQPTEEPTREPFLLPPTQAATTTPATGALTATTAFPATGTPAITSVPPATLAPVATNTLPTARPAASRPTNVPPRPSPRPTQAPAQPTQAPPASTSTEVLTLYFADPTGRLYVPVQRRVTVENNQVARAAIRELIVGPRNGLGRLVLPDARLLDLQIDGGTATVNFDRRPTGAGDDRGLYAMTLTLTHFSTIQRVQFQVNGKNIGVGGDAGPLTRPTLNPINPQNLPYDTQQTEFLPLYFVSADGRHDIRLIRMVPKTQQTAEATVRALLEGPGEYGSAVQRVIPPGTELRGIRLEKGTVIVDFTQPFASAANRAAAVRTVAESLTTLRTISGVLFLVEGRSLGEHWGGEYGKVFGRVAINPE